MPATTDKSQPEMPPTASRKRWRSYVLLVILTVFGLALILVNGPVGRWIIRTQIDQLAEKQQIKGSLLLNGTLLSGYSLTDINYTGDLGIQTLRADRIEIRYRLGDLMNQKLENVALDSLQLRIDVAKFPESDKPPDQKKQKPKGDLKPLLGKLRPWIIQSELTFKDLDAKLLKAEKPVVAVQVNELSHTADSDAFKLRHFSAQNANRLNTEPQDILLQWKARGLLLDQWELLPDLVLQQTAVDWSSALQCSTGLSVNGALLQVEVDDDLSIELSQGLFSTDFIEKTFGLTLPAEGVIDQLRLRVADRKAPIADWDATADLHLLSADYQKFQLKDSFVTLRQSDKQYQVSIKGTLNQAPIEFSADGEWTAGDIWWKNTDANISIKTPKLGNLPNVWLQTPDHIDLADTNISLNGRVKIANAKLESATASGQVSPVNLGQSKFPPIVLSTDFENAVVNASVNLGEDDNYVTKAQVTYDLTKRSYNGSLAINADEPAWINALINVKRQNLRLVGPTNILWTGSGKIEDKPTDADHKGELKISDLSLKLNKIPQVDLITKLDYDFPRSIEVHTLKASEENWHATGNLSWDGKTILLPKFEIANQDKQFANLSGHIPYRIDVQSAEDFFSQTENMSLLVSVNPLSLREIEENTGLQIPRDVEGKVEADLNLSGSPASPELEGYANLLGVSGLSPKLDKLIDLNLNFQSMESSLEITSMLQEGQNDRISLQGTIPFSPKRLLEDPKSAIDELKDAPLKAECSIQDLPMARVAKFVPKLDQVKGTVSAQGTFTGTINNPEYKLDLNAKVPLVATSNSAIGDVRDLVLDSVLTQDRIIANQFTARINGGKFSINGTVDINDFKKPIFDLVLKCNHGLIYRNDLVSARANADLNLLGSIEDATISGSIGMTESLIYKDIELIPIGIPSSAVVKVTLPTISSGASKTLPIPLPYGGWKLDVVIKTDDPILIRGNIASGRIEGSIKVGGLLNQPEPDGFAYVTNAKAMLPFSILKIKKGEVLFTPRTGLMNPELNIAGTCAVADTDINLLVYGNVNRPKTSLTSSPPYPEPEIMALIATGSTTSTLENSNAVALKAFKLFLLKLEEGNQLGGNQLFDALLSGIDSLNLQVGKDEKFTGRKFSSAGLDLTDHWNLTAEIDEEQNSRGLVVYQLRFK